MSLINAVLTSRDRHVEYTASDLPNGPWTGYMDQVDTDTSKAVSYPVSRIPNEGSKFRLHLKNGQVAVPVWYFASTNKNYNSNSPYIAATMTDKGFNSGYEAYRSFSGADVSVVLNKLQATNDTWATYVTTYIPSTDLVHDSFTENFSFVNPTEKSAMKLATQICFILNSSDNFVEAMRSVLRLQDYQCTKGSEFSGPVLFGDYE